MTALDLPAILVSLVGRLLPAGILGSSQAQAYVQKHGDHHFQKQSLLTSMVDGEDVLEYGSLNHLAEVCRGFSTALSLLQKSMHPISRGNFGSSPYLATPESEELTHQQLTQYKACWLEGD